MALTGNTMNGTAVGYRCRVSKVWYYTNGNWCAFTTTPGVTPSISSPQMSSSDTSATGNQYCVVIQYKTPNDASIASIQKLACSFKVYDRNTTKGALYGSLRTVAPNDTNADTWANMRQNAIGNEASISTLTTTATKTTFTFEGSLAKNTTYYLYLYTKSTNDIFTIQTGSSHSADFSCVATYTKNSYTVSYNANGGSGAPSSQTKIYGETLTLSSTKPTKSNGSNTVSGSFVITGNGNGGYFGNTSTTTTSITATSSTPQTITYTFSKWKDGSGNEYAAGGSYTANSAATLTAQYTSSTTNGTTTYSNNSISKLATPSRGSSKVATYTVSFNANGGSCSTSSLTADKTRTFTFKGWAESSTATSTLATNKTYTAAKTVYAVWGQSDSTAAITLPTPTRSGYTFRGWATDASASSGTTGLYEPDGNITLYAIWSQDYSTVYYNDNGKCVACCVYYNNNGTAVLCNVYYNNNGSAVQI